ncbi:cytosolic phospholipase A2-like isoform X1 [Clavelina lepadiformis]|uniref:cytosolic phospholipase A2-like isoform X1 n=1 Tax=Clavelina lepadiformis TaxID=159417 RepID=UPI0040436D68
MTNEEAAKVLEPVDGEALVPGRKPAIRRKSPKLSSKSRRLYDSTQDLTKEDGAGENEVPNSPVQVTLTSSEGNFEQTLVESLENGGEKTSDKMQSSRRTATNLTQDSLDDADYFDAQAHLAGDLSSLTVSSEPPLRNGRVRSKTDPFQFFEVKHDPCHQLTVRVLRGRNISKGLFGDIFDVPDPYIEIHIHNAPDGKKATSHVDNNPNPEWDETLTYFLPTGDEKNIIAEISLMDSNYSVDEILGKVEFDIGKIPLETTVLRTFSFNETSEVDIEFRKEVKYDSNLRSSLALCEEEKAFRSARKSKVLKAMRILLEKHNRVGGPRTMREAPVITVLGSGGGFRAMTGYAGAIKALHDSGVLDCCTYLTGLSGSSWYLACLYAHENFPVRGPTEVNAEIRHFIENSPFWLLRPECLMRYSHRLHAKMKAGQPVTFTDFFGMLIGQTLLGAEKMQTAKLSDFQNKIKDGGAPMPMMTCLHVRPKTSAMTFHDWVEFSPFEIGIAKYGTFMNTKHFGSKFFMGVLAKQFEESPLHFLMGVWGSAFSILFNRLLEKSHGIADNIKKAVDFRQEMQEELTQCMQSNDDGDDSSDETADDTDSEYDDAVENPPNPHPPLTRTTWFGGRSNSPEKCKSNGRSGMMRWLDWGGSMEEPDEVEEKPKPKKPHSRSFLNSLIGSVFGTDILESREYRAGKILNYMRGVSLSRPYYLLSPFTPFDENNTIAEVGEFEKIHEPIEVKRKKVHMVDAGLTFNSPYPPMLRPQRTVDLILSFDFSGRDSDNSEPFKEILLAEKWAKLHHLPFPKIDRSVFEREGMKECYVFRDEEDERAPIIIHFVLCNVLFRKFKRPGVPRARGDTSGDFDIFDAPKTPYSTFNFQYANEEFDRLRDLVEFNTLLHIDTIIEEIINCSNLRRRSQIRGSITLKDVRNSVHLSEKNKRSLEKNLLNAGGSFHLD